MFNNNIIWVTKLIQKQDFDTPAAALKNATELIENWCKQNGFEYEINHNKDTGCNRVLTIKTNYRIYNYKFIISGYEKPTGEQEPSYNLFGEKWLVDITKPAYYAHLDRL